MTWMDYGLLILVAALVALAVYRVRANKQKGKGCCGSCAGCTMACSQKKPNDTKPGPPAGFS